MRQTVAQALCRPDVPTSFFVIVTYEPDPGPRRCDVYVYPVIAVRSLATDEGLEEELLVLADVDGGDAVYPMEELLRPFSGEQVLHRVIRHMGPMRPEHALEVAKGILADERSSPYFMGSLPAEPTPTASDETPR